MSYDAARRQVRTLESRLDAALNQYSRVAADIARGGDGGINNDAGGIGGSGGGAVSSSAALAAYRAAEEGRGRTTRAAAAGASGSGNGNGSDKYAAAAAAREAHEADIERMLAELSDADTRLANALEDPMIPPSASMQHALQRHREVLIDFERDYRRSYASVQQALDRRNLLGSVKIDIENYKAQHGGDADALLAERTRLDNSHRMLDGTLDQAYATRADLASQRTTLSGMAARMSDTASRVPGLNNVIRLISRRRQRDRIIMGFVIGSCTVLLLMYLTR